MSLWDLITLAASLVWNDSANEKERLLADWHRESERIYAQAVREIRLKPERIDGMQLIYNIPGDRFGLRCIRRTWALLDAFLLRVQLLKRLFVATDMPLDIYRVILRMLFSDKDRVKLGGGEQEVALWVTNRSNKTERLFY